MSYPIDRSSLERQPSRNESGQIACSLPPSLERDNGWRKTLDRQKQKKELNPVQEGAAAVTATATAPTVFTSAEWTAAAMANPKPSDILETEHGYNAPRGKLHSNASISRLMQCIEPERLQTGKGPQVVTRASRGGLIDSDDEDDEEDAFLTNSSPVIGNNHMMLVSNEKVPVSPRQPPSDAAIEMDQGGGGGGGSKEQPQPKANHKKKGFLGKMSHKLRSSMIQK